MADVTVEIDERALRRAALASAETQALVQKRTDEIIGRANALSTGMRTGVWHDHDTGRTLGDTEPIFDGNVQKRGDSYVGIVYTANYAAQKANMESNILLKARG